ncbi:hypothetical protein BASA50_003263 [Batrachochytrium salamandrivorans]|uniref:RRM domain-containing protein n=1 Tax=Batrachochytrium salamandrivorans TaxID=1357716 RepID=A0ABQ8FJD3_9FUNG|nr:hypothetical protein BASA50_003263 [Batrachochytrium salamandrivorans]KAJ1336250.1 hypothetical protein BSLG_007478 [Batrachochytrium salamandrivorans]
MTSQLPPNLLRLFAPRPGLPYKPAAADPKTKRLPIYSSVCSFLPMCRMGHDPDYIATETMEDRKKRMVAEKAERTAAALAKAVSAWDPHKDEKATAEPYKTLFVSRLSYATTEKSLRKEFEAFGEVKSVIVVLDTKDSKSRGYAFIEFEHERDMKVAYKEAEGLKIDGRRILVDVERGRTVPGWKPRRLGGGLGGTRHGSLSSSTTATAAATTTAAVDAAPASSVTRSSGREGGRSSSTGGYRDSDRDGGGGSSSSYRHSSGRDSRDSSSRYDDHRGGSRYDDDRSSSRYGSGGGGGSSSSRSDDRRGNGGYGGGSSDDRGSSSSHYDRYQDRDRGRGDRDRDRRRSRSPRRRDEPRESRSRY